MIKKNEEMEENGEVRDKLIIVAYMKYKTSSEISQEYKKCI